MNEPTKPTTARRALEYCEQLPHLAHKRPLLQAGLADLTRMEARMAELEKGLASAIRELERVDNVKDGHPLVSHNLLYNLRGMQVKQTSDLKCGDD